MLLSQKEDNALFRMAGGPTTVQGGGSTDESVYRRGTVTQILQ